MSEEAKDLVHLPERPAAPPAPPADAGLLAIFSAKEPLFLTNLPLDTAWGMAILTKAQGPADVDLASVDGKVWQTQYWLAHVVDIQLEDEGEIVKRIRVVLIDGEGNTLAWSSEITTRYFATIYVAKGPGPWDPPIALTFRKHKGKKQGFWFQPTLAIPEPPKKKGK